MLPLKYPSAFGRTFEIPLINCEINLILTCSAVCVIVSTTNANQGATFAITDIKLYVLIVTLSTQDKVKLFQQLKPGYQSKVSTETQN